MLFLIINILMLSEWAVDWQPNHCLFGFISCGIWAVAAVYSLVAYAQLWRTLCNESVVHQVFADFTSGRLQRDIGTNVPVTLDEARNWGSPHCLKIVEFLYYKYRRTVSFHLKNNGKKWTEGCKYYLQAAGVASFCYLLRWPTESCNYVWSFRRAERMLYERLVIVLATPLFFRSVQSEIGQWRETYRCIRDAYPFVICKIGCKFVNNENCKYDCKADCKADSNDDKRFRSLSRILYRTFEIAYVRCDNESKNKPAAHLNNFPVIEENADIVDFLKQFYMHARKWKNPCDTAVLETIWLALLQASFAPQTAVDTWIWIHSLNADTITFSLPTENEMENRFQSPLPLVSFPRVKHMYNDLCRNLPEKSVLFAEIIGRKRYINYLITGTPP